MKIEKPSHLLAVAGWMSVFVQGWLIILRLIHSDGLTWIIFSFFLFVAVMASAVTRGLPKIKASDGIFHIEYLDASTIELTRKQDA